jgi:hypothetical protein
MTTSATTSKATAKTVRPLYTIAQEIRKDWGAKMYFGAVPYFKAMETLNSIKDNYGCDSAWSIVAYFLANAQTWKGDKAREIKKELNAMLKAK